MYGRSLKRFEVVVLIFNILLARASLDECPALIPVAVKSSLSNGACPLPIDNASGSYSHGITNTIGGPAAVSPWTHRPECEYTADRTAKYCVYTNSRHGSHGWSLISSPETAADSVRFLDIAFTPSRLNTSREADALYRILDIPGKGKGLVATRRIRPYEELLLDYATIVVDIAFTTNVPSILGYRLLRAAVDRLADPVSVLELGKSNDFAQDDVENVLRTNAFHTSLGGIPHIALYPTVSRINHACKPNAYTRFMEDKLQVSVVSARAIEEGEEITISYIALGQTWEERQNKLRQWGFNCTCSLCTASKAEIAASDARRRHIESLWTQAAQAFQAGKPYHALRFTRQIIKLLPSEDLFPMYAEQYGNMARIYFVLGDMENATKYATMMLETLALQGDIDSVRPEHYEEVWRRFKNGEELKI